MLNFSSIRYFEILDNLKGEQFTNTVKSWLIVLRYIVFLDSSLNFYSPEQIISKLSKKSPHSSFLDKSFSRIYWLEFSVQNDINTGLIVFKGKLKKIITSYL